MAHHVYQTEALVLRSAASGDSNCFVDIFSRELGFVRAIAQSARRERSKMRYALQEYTHVHIALVRGRMYWRITGTQEIQNFYYKGRDDDTHVLLAKVNTLLRRLLHGEEKNERLYTSVLTFFLYATGGSMKKEYLKPVESLVVLRILHHLGYIAGHGVLLETDDFSDEILNEVIRRQSSIVKDINSALKESQL